MLHMQHTRCSVHHHGEGHFGKVAALAKKARKTWGPKPPRCEITELSIFPQGAAEIVRMGSNTAFTGHIDRNKPTRIVLSPHHFMP
jgi:hypothetical protein